MVFVVDSSGSICANEPVDTCDNWDIILQFMQDLVDYLDIGLSKTRIGVVVYRETAHTVFHLNEYGSKRTIMDAIKNLQYVHSGTTNTSGGLRVMDRIMFSATNGDRPDVRNIGIVITDGESNRDSDRTISDAEAARLGETFLYVVGITDEVNRDELKGISSQPQLLNDTWFVSPDFAALNTIKVLVAEKLCPPSPPVPGE